MSNELVEAGLKLASSSQGGSKRGTEYLDRTIYHTVYKTGADGNIMVDGNGDKIVENQALYIASSYLSKAEMENALATEKKFKVLNEKLRDDMTRKKMVWQIPKSAQTKLQIQGVTGI